MKNQYFGDINDYRKYGLPRVLAKGEKINTAICWMLTRDDEPIDGYLQPLTRATRFHMISMFRLGSSPGLCRPMRTSQAEALRA